MPIVSPKVTSKSVFDKQLSKKKTSEGNNNIESSKDLKRLSSD